MKRLIGLICVTVCPITLATIVSTKSTAQSDQTSAYYCVAEVAGGLTYDEVQQKWVGAAFRPNDKFVVRLKFVRTYVIPKQNEFDEDRPTKVYEVTITGGYGGGNFEQQCISGHGKEVSVDEFYNVVTCDANLLDYKINLNLNRYLLTYSVGYAVVAGEHGEKHAEQPFVEGGTCTKIE